MINKAAQFYKGRLSEDGWKELYMSTKELRVEIEAGVSFYCWVEDELLVG